ncbi:MAG: glycosyltransferase family 2 protein [Planctomycetia bacterium]|nr:glycosyltransferase family 2 protein [Planctomycetia bacterium]
MGRIPDLGQTGMPFFTCIVLSHDKPARVAEALASLAAQTFTDWEAIVFDSGVLTDRGFFENLLVAKDPRFQFVRSWETEELRRSKTIASWCFNECFRQKMVRGTWVTYLCDDDLLYPGALAAFHDHVQNHPQTRVMYASIDMTVINPQGERLLLRESIAREMKGACCRGGRLDGEVDYLQLCHHVDALNVFPNDEYWPEDRAVIRHADGVFLEQIGRHFPIEPVDAKIGENRKVPESLNDGGERLAVLERLCRRAERIRRLRKRLGIVDGMLVRSGVAGLIRSVARRMPGLR